jgi:predicted PurR-regulated permease PerM
MNDGSRLQSESAEFRLILPLSTIAKVLITALLVWCLNILTPLVLTLFFGVLVAVSMEPVVRWFQRHGIGRPFAITILALILASVMIGFGVTIVPALFEEVSGLISKLPELKSQFVDSVPSSSIFKPIVDRLLDQKTLMPKSVEIAPIFNVGNTVLSGVGEFILVFVIAIYLLIDGKKVIKWIAVFFRPEIQDKISQTGFELSKIISSYVTGQLVTSLLSFFYVLIVLSFLKVPSVLLLATLAAIFDILPVLGFFLAVIPAMLFAVSVSGNTSLLVFAAYILYHLIENYLIIPAIYGKHLRVSGLVVLITLIAAGLLGGVQGAIVALPIVASYPIVERIWLRRFVGKATVQDHSEPQDQAT